MRRCAVHRCCVHVHAFRVSARLLRALHDAAEAGRIGYGEQALSTVCVGEGLTWRSLRDCHVGEPFHPDESMGEAAFAERPVHLHHKIFVRKCRCRLKMMHETPK